jgi:hypothetical protein
MVLPSRGDQWFPGMSPLSCTFEADKQKSFVFWFTKAACQGLILEAISQIFQAEKKTTYQDL